MSYTNFDINNIESLSVYIPSNINIDELLNDNNISIPNAKDYLLYILSIIEIDKDNKKYTKINSVKLQYVVDNYKALLVWLLDLGILEIDRDFIIGEQSKGYRYNQNYINEIKENRIFKKTLIRKILKNNNSLYLNANLKSSIQEKTTVSENVNLPYGYNDYWIDLKQLATILNLKSTKMLQGLKELNIILPHYAFEYNNGNYAWYKWIMIEQQYSNESYPKILFGTDAESIILFFANKYPLLFPKIKK